MPVFRECTIEWGDETLRFTPSMKLLHRIESGGEMGSSVSVMQLMQSLTEGKPLPGQMSYVMATVLQWAGADVEQDELYALALEDAEKFTALWFAIFNILSPDTGKKKEEESK